MTKNLNDINVLQYESVKPFNVFNNPTETMEEVKEYTPEETFYNSEQEVSEITDQYIVYLEQQNRAMKKAIKVLHDEAEAMPSATYWKNQLWKIFKQ